jgi:hypothetical protein
MRRMDRLFPPLAFALALLALLSGGCGPGGRLGTYLPPLRNAGFEHWTDAGLPVHWDVRPGHEAMAGRDDAHSTEGAASLRLAGEFTYMYLTQDVGSLGELAGRLVEVAADVKCHEPEAASIYVIQPDFGELYSPKHPGDGEWHTLRISFRVPAFSVHDALTVRLGVGNVPQKPCYFDNVRVRVLDG